MDFMDCDFFCNPFTDFQNIAIQNTNCNSFAVDESMGNPNPNLLQTESSHPDGLQTKLSNSNVLQNSAMHLNLLRATPGQGEFGFAELVSC